MRVLSFVFKSKYVFLAVSLIYLIWLVHLFTRFCNQEYLNDFSVFFNSGQRILKYENIYGEPYFNNLKYFYSPLFASLLSCFNVLDINRIHEIWFFLNVICLYRVFYLLFAHVILCSKRSFLIITLLFIFFSKIILLNLLNGQVTIFILWLVFEGFYYLKKGHDFIALFMICIAINIKILPILLIPYIIYISKNKIKNTIYLMLFSFVFLLIPAFYLGWEYNNFLIKEWFLSINPFNKMHVIQIYESGFLDLGALVSKYLSNEKVLNEPCCNIVNLNSDIIFALTNFLRLSLFLCSAYISLKLKRQVYGISFQTVIFAAFSALIPLCLPHQREYSFLFFLPLVAILLTMILNNKSKMELIIFILLLFISGLAIWVDFAGNYIVDSFTNYRIITIGMILLYVLYIYKVINFSKIKEIKIHKE